MTVAELFALSDADALRSNGTDAEENDGQDPTVANSNNIHQAFDEILAKSSKGLARGNVQGFVNACRDFGVSRNEALVRVARRFNLTDEDARSEVERCWEAKETK